MIIFRQLNWPRRAKKAGSLVEITFGSIFLFFAVIVLIDLGLLIYGASLNDSVCREAARKAAAGDPIKAESRALLFIEHTNARGGGLVSHFRLIPPLLVNITSQPKLRREPENDELRYPGGLITGSVAVSTEAQFTPLILHIFLGQKPPMKLVSNQSFPISYISPAH